MNPLPYWLRRLGARLFGNVDTTLLAVTLTLVVLGLATLYSASFENPARVRAQAGNVAFALAMMWIVARIQPETLMRLAAPAYVGGLVLLVAVALFGETANGARRWLNIGIGRFQPSEIMKLAVPLMLAWFFHRKESSLRLTDFVVAALLVMIPVVLIARQPDLGTAVLVFASGAFVIFFAGLNWRVIAVLAAGAAIAVVPMWNMLHGYQRKRILTLLDPSQDPLGSGYHIIQSTIAVGSGGFFGKGWLNGTQAHLEFIPERQTDFIFAVFSEEFGLLGNCILLALYALLIGRGISIALSASTVFARLAAASITLMFFTYIFVNMGMVSGILPVVGVPLPFLSYGGTALVTLFTAIGLLMSIRRYPKLVRT